MKPDPGDRDWRSTLVRLAFRLTILAYNLRRGLTLVQRPRLIAASTSVHDSATGEVLADPDALVDRAARLRTSGQLVDYVQD